MFWRFAHRNYHRRRLSLLAEIAVSSWTVFFAFIYSIALVHGWRPADAGGAAVAVLLTIVPTIWVVAHWRIRTEAAKGDDALYRKLVSASRGGRGSSRPA